MTETVRVEVELSSELAENLRRLVGNSREAWAVFVEMAIHRELLLEAGHTMRYGELAPEEAQAIVDQAVAEVRQERAARHA